MWFKGAVILGSIWILNGLLSLVELALGAALPAVIYWVIPAVICSQLANYDYFKFVTNDEKLWPGFPEVFSKPVGAIGYPVVGFLFLIFSVGGFSSKIPECSSSEATDLVLQLSKGEFVNQLGGVANSIDLSVSAIRTTSVNEQTGAYECAAQLDVVGPNGSSALPITYTVEMTDNGEEFYVNVFGLR